MPGKDTTFGRILAFVTAGVLCGVLVAGAGRYNRHRMNQDLAAVSELRAGHHRLAWL